jgi:phage protein D
MSNNENNQNASIVSFDINISGQVISETTPVSSITVFKQSNQKTISQITFFPPNNFEENAFNVGQIGDTISVELGYDGENTLVFDGIIEGQTLQIENQTGAILTIHGKENVHHEEISHLDLLNLANSPTDPVFIATYGINILNLMVNIVNTDNTQTKVFGNFEIVGNNNIQPNDFIELKNIGNQFNGTHFVFAVKQKVENGNWTSQIYFGVQKP